MLMNGKSYLIPILMYCIIQEQEPGSLIFTITATDDDHGRNGDVSFTILEENDWQKFAITPSGNLTFKEKLDRETKASYEVSGKLSQ